MITRLEQSEHRLLIEARSRLRWPQIGRIVAVFLLIVALCAVMFLGFQWMLSTSGMELEQDHGELVVGSVMLLVIMLWGLLWLASSQERIEVEGSVLVYMRRLGPFRGSVERYDVLEMHGLRWDMTSGGPLPGTLLPGVSEDPPPCELESAIGPTMAVWYKGEPFIFGHTFEAAERKRVADALLVYEQGLRGRLGLSLEQGLSDSSIWTTSRTQALTVMYAPHKFTGLYFGRASDYDR